MKCTGMFLFFNFVVDVNSAVPYEDILTRATENKNYHSAAL